MFDECCRPSFLHAPRVQAVCVLLASVRSGVEFMVVLFIILIVNSYRDIPQLLH